MAPVLGPLTPRRVVLALAVLVGALVVAEVALRAWIRHGANDEDFRRYASIEDFRRRGGDGLFLRHAYLGYVPRPGFARGGNRHDSRGFRGEDVAVPKPPGEFRVVCVGGSTTYTQDVDDWRASYPARLEEELRARGRTTARVVNAGVPNWTSFEHLVSYPFRLRELDADLLVVLEGVNDLKARLVADPRDYRPDNSGYRSFSTNLTMPPLREHFALWRFVAVNAGWMRAHADLERALDNHTGLSLWGALRAQMRDGSYPAGEMVQHPADAVLERTPPVHFERNLEDLAVLARRDGTDVVFLTSPACTARVARSDQAARIFEAGLRQMDAAARRAADRAGARVFDLADALPRDPALFLDEAHWNEAGAREVARLVATAVLDAPRDAPPPGPREPEPR